MVRRVYSDRDHALHLRFSDLEDLEQRLPWEFTHAVCPIELGWSYVRLFNVG